MEAGVCLRRRLCVNPQGAVPDACFSNSFSVLSVRIGRRYTTECQLSAVEQHMNEMSGQLGAISVPWSDGAQPNAPSWKTVMEMHVGLFGHGACAVQSLEGQA